MSVRFYNGPPIDLACVRAYRTVLTKHLERPPSIDEIVKKIHQDMYTALPESYVRVRVEGALELEKTHSSRGKVK